MDRIDVIGCSEPRGSSDIRSAPNSERAIQVKLILSSEWGGVMIETIKTTLRIFVPQGTRLRWVGLVALGLVIAVAEVLAAFLMFRVLGVATDNVDLAGSLPLGLEVSFTTLLTVAGVAFVVLGLLTLFNAYVQARVVQSASAAVSSLLHRRYLVAPYRFHLTRSSSESVRTVLWSVDQATVNALNPIISISTQMLIAVTMFSFLIAIAPVLSLLAIGIFGFGLAIVLYFVQPRLQRLGKLSEKTVKSMLVNVKDSFDSVRDIKIYRAERHFDRQFSRNRNILAGLRTSRSLLEQVPSTSLELMVVAGLLVLIGVAQGGDFAEVIPVLGAFGYAALRVTPSLNKVVLNVNRLRFGSEAVKNVERDLKSAEPVAANSAVDGSVSIDRLFRERIDLSSISFTYPGAESPALVKVSLTIRHGETLAIVGESGSGKSTLVDVLLGLLEPDSGDITIDGSTALPADWHRHVGVVSQSVVLLDGTVRENVAFGTGSEADDERVLDALAKSQLTEWLAGLPNGLDSLVGESGKLVSGGERQRISVARSLYRAPDLLVLDEATSAIDGATEAALIDGLLSLEDGPTTILVSHRIAPIKAADRIVYMAEGHVLASGSYDELLSDNLDFRSLVGL